MEIFKLMGSILVDSDGAEKSISKTGDKADGMGKKLGKGIGIAAKLGAALVAGAAAGAGAIFALGVKLGNTADEILDLNSITGMSTDEIQKWRKATEIAGVESNAMTNASVKLTKSMDLMSSGTGKGAESLEKLGFSFKEIENMSADERMDVLTEALAGVDDKTERARIGTDLFGSSWKEIAPVVDLGAEAMDKAKNSANIISEGDLKKANDFRIKVADMKDQLGFFVTKITIALLPALNGMMTWFGEKMPAIQSFVKTAFDNIQVAVGVVADFFTTSVIPKIKALWDWVQPHLPMIKDAFVTAFDQVVTILTDVGMYISEKVIAKLQELWDWISPHMPMIKEAMKTAFEGVKEAISYSIQAIKDITKWFEDHWAIVEPILIGVAAGATAFYLITGAIAAYGAITKAITAVQLLFNAALTMNPIGIVVIAIGLLVAAGILLYRNWDTVKEKLGLAMGFIKEKSISIFNFLIEFFKKWGLTILAVITGPIGLLVLAIYKNWDAITTKTSAFASAVSNKIKDMKDKVIARVTELAISAVRKFNDLKTGAANKFGEILTSATTKFNAIKSAIMDPVNAAKDAVSSAVEKIKGFFTGMTLKLPSIKVPSFSLKNWSINPADWIKNMPSIGISWNAKGGLFTKPTVFNTPMGLQGFGEAGPEAAIPLTSSVLGMIGQKISDTMDAKNASTSGQVIIVQSILDGQIIAESTHDASQQLFGASSKSSAFFNGVR